MPKKFTSGRALAWSVRKVPLPMPISISTGFSLPYSSRHTIGRGSVSTSSPIGSTINSRLVCIAGGLYVRQRHFEADAPTLAIAQHRWQGDDQSHDERNCTGDQVPPLGAGGEDDAQHGGGGGDQPAAGDADDAG